ncbi:AI-2E family transporter [Robiginitomaculum antarcticum]|uniref:AI-2E family transporter n=1 Tax=Robiginitomaculum antarcticum TaxID=437507 RepID=UPI000372349E|nr:AI-2E family transporter [Robiginitomaculum antarcticum]
MTTTTTRASLLFIAFLGAIGLLYVGRDVFTPFALAVFIWLIIDALARWIDRLHSKIPYWTALIIAVLIVVAGLVGIVFIIADTAASVVDQAPRYGRRLDEIFHWVGSLVGQPDLSVSNFMNKLGLNDKIQSGLAGFANSIQGVFGNFLLIAIYVAFLFAAQSSFPKKMDDLFPDQMARARAGKVGLRMRHSIEKYLGVQTIISLMQTVVSYGFMAAVGLENALFWALVIFILNYIPIVGGFAAVLLPVVFGLVQFETLTPIIIMASGLLGAQFVIGNTIQPKMMGDSMNLSALVVVLSLTLWGALWGGVGAFLSAPLTVIIMIILAQFPSTRWIAILLSADGQPDLDPDEKAAKNATPGM